MDFFLLIMAVIMIILGIIYLVIYSNDSSDYVIGGSICVIGLFAFALSLINPFKETLYKLTITDTVTNKEKVYEFVTDIEEHESYIKFTDKDGNEQYLMMEDKEILKEELE